MATSASVLQSVAAQGQSGAGDQPAGSSKDVLQSVASDAQSSAKVKMVSPSGAVAMVNPDEVGGYKSAGHTQIDANGYFTPQTIKGEDPLETEKRRQRIYKALTPEERAGGQKEEIKNTLSTGADAATATAAGVTGAGALGGGLMALGETEAVQLLKSSPKLYAEYILKQKILPKAGEMAADAGKAALKGAAAYLGFKWLGKMI